MRSASPLLVLLLCAGAAAAQDFLDCHLVPGWQPAGARRQYTAENLYDYKDGAAEGYLLYGLTRMTSIDCKAGAVTLTVDLSEMSDADAAYGIFAANLDPAQPVAQIGMGGQVQAQSAIFAKGKYYVELVETGAAADSNAAETLRAFVTQIEVRLEGRVTPPQPLHWFLPENVGPVRMVPQSVLGLQQLKRGYVARYAQGQAFIVFEATPETAGVVLQNLRLHFAGATAADVGDEAFTIRAPYLGVLCVFRKGRILAGYANLTDPQQATALAAQLAARIP